MAKNTLYFPFHITIWTVLQVMKLMSVFSFPIENNDVVRELPMLDQAEFWILVLLAVLSSPVNTKEPGWCMVWAKGKPHVCNFSVLAEKTVHDGTGTYGQCAHVHMSQGASGKSMHLENSSQMSRDFLWGKCWWDQQTCVVVKQKSNIRITIFPSTWVSFLHSHVIL